jgi:2-polyprenyl-3-methyl-5-hydroxy-6-metoxy-1,4-benzoquinol methylase
MKNVISKNYYTTKHSNNNIYDIWENGKALGDSITPSTFNVEYQTWMLQLLIDLTENNVVQKKVLSLGCGNAVVEGKLVNQGLLVDAFDVHEDAISYAKEKGVNARIQDIKTWNPLPESYDLIYCDGIVGHLFESDSGLLPLFEKLYSALNPNGAVVVSNDASDKAEDVVSHPSVPEFYWFTGKYLESQLQDSQFTNITQDTYTYTRPESGSRERTIVYARKGMAQ